MEEPSQSAQNLGTPSPTLLTIEEKIARGADIQNYRGLANDPEKRARIEEMLRKGIGVVRTAQETGSSHNTVMVIRDQLMEREPGIFKASLVNNLQRIAIKTAATIERGIDQLEDKEIGTGNLAQLSVTLGISLDKLANLSGEQQIQVVEHRLKIDAGTVSSLIKARQEAQEAKIIEAEVVSVDDASTT